MQYPETNTDILDFVTSRYSHRSAAQDNEGNRDACASDGNFTFFVVDLHFGIVKHCK